MMTTLLLVLVAVLAVGEFLLFGALAEAYRDIRQIRERAGVIDRNAPVDLGPALGQAPSSLGLDPTLDSAVQAVVVYLNDRCGTCRSIVGSLAGQIPAGMWLVIIADAVDAAFDWLNTDGAMAGSPDAARVLTSTPEEAEQNLGLLLTPLALVIEHGRLSRAMTIPSVRQFYVLAPDPKTIAPRLKKGIAT
jgi:hypothetical protein